jgi:uncharacterized membrane protein
MLLSGFGTLLWLLNLAMLLLAIVALVFAVITREDAFRATSKQTKKFWVIVLGVVVLVNVFVPMLLLQIAGLVATIVFLVDVRPAVRQIAGRGRGSGGGSSSDGPYGPYNGGR